MRRFRLKLIENERGATIILIAVSLVVVVGCVALVVDLGMLRDARSESQRAADASALAGAATLLDVAPTVDPRPAIRQAAIVYAGANRMRGTPIAPSEVVNVEYVPDSAKVRVTLQRPEVGTWFARALGTNSVSVGSQAAARVMQSGTVSCLKPFVVPDNAYNPNSWGERRIVVDQRSDYFLLVGYGQGPPGGGNFQNDIRLPCNDRTARLSLADPWLWAKPSGGLPPGQIRNPFNDLYASDPDLTYNQSDGRFYRNGVVENNWRASPRVTNVAIVDAGTVVLNPSGTYQVRIVDFVSVFFEGPAGQHLSGCAGNPNNAYCSTSSSTWVWGRFFPAIGQADNCVATNTCAPSAIRLRLVE